MRLPVSPTGMLMFRYSCVPPALTPVMVPVTVFGNKLTMLLVPPLLVSNPEPLIVKVVAFWASKLVFVGVTYTIANDW